MRTLAIIAIVAALAGTPLSVRLVADNVPLPAPQPGGHEPARVIARAGDWITYPNGIQVCLLNQDLRAGDNIGNSAFWRRVCGLWTEAPPQPMTRIPGWIRRDSWSWQVHVTDGWVP